MFRPCTIQQIFEGRINFSCDSLNRIIAIRLFEREYLCVYCVTHMHVMPNNSEFTFSMLGLFSSGAAPSFGTPSITPAAGGVPASAAPVTTSAPALSFGGQLSEQ